MDFHNNKVISCIIIPINYNDNFLHIGTKESPRFINFELNSVNQKILTEKLFNEISYKTNRKFVWIDNFEFEKREYRVYAIADNFDYGNYSEISINCLFDMLNSNKILEPITKFSTEIIKNHVVNKKHFDPKINKFAKKANNMFEKILQNKKINLKKSKEYIKKFYQGDPKLMGYYSDMNLSRLFSELLNAKNGSILEPSCGTGRLFEFLDNSALSITGYDIDPRSVKICRFLYPNANIICDNTLTNLKELENKFDFCICNPPWGLHIENMNNVYEIPNQLETEDCTFYFLELCIRALKEGGVCAIGLPTSIFTLKQFQNLFQLINKWVKIIARVDLPEECFKTSNIFIESSILVFTKIEQNSCERQAILYHKVDYDQWIKYISGNKDSELNRVIKQISARI